MVRIQENERKERKAKKKKIEGKVKKWITIWKERRKGINERKKKIETHRKKERQKRKRKKKNVKF